MDFLRQSCSNFQDMPKIRHSMKCFYLNKIFSVISELHRKMQILRFLCLSKYLFIYFNIIISERENVVKLTLMSGKHRTPLVVVENLNAVVILILM